MTHPARSLQEVGSLSARCRKPFEFPLGCAPCTKRLTCPFAKRYRAGLPAGEGVTSPLATRTSPLDCRLLLPRESGRLRPDQKTVRGPAAAIRGRGRHLPIDYGDEGVPSPLVTSPSFTRNPWSMRSSIRAFTFVELLAVMGILAVLIALVFTTTSSLIQRAEKPACMANLKNLHMALSAYLVDNQKWPQVPNGIDLNSPEECSWWRTTLAPYGMVDKSWICPTLRRTAIEKNMEAALQENHYVPSLFDEFPATPYRWPNMPWAMEIGNNHGTGILIIMMDGSIKPYEEFQKNAQK